jgi:dTDP-4-dehydrorhamnose 3,5-epimerase-like enzyme
MVEKVSEEIAKKVSTKDHSGNENGFLIEMFKSEDGKKTEVYLSAAKPGAFKGYHLHRVRAARYVCVKGKMRIILYQPSEENGKTTWIREEHILAANEPKRLFIPKNIATGLENIGEEEGWLVNYPDPAYDPELKDEQVEYTQKELEQGVVK